VSPTDDQLICRVQFHWSSAYDGYENGSLRRDVSEMRALALHLRAQGRHFSVHLAACADASSGVTDLVWMGNSTGCQDIACSLSDSSRDDCSNPIIKGGILQAPVSDRESIEHWQETDVMSRAHAQVLLAAAEEANAMVGAGESASMVDEVAPKIRKEIGGRLTWSRAFSLYGKG
jgi:hypothetical protein